MSRVSGVTKGKSVPHCGDFVHGPTHAGAATGTWRGGRRSLGVEMPLCQHSMARRDLPLAVSFPKGVWFFSTQCCSILLASPGWWLALTKNSVYLPRLLNRESEKPTYWANAGTWAAWLGTRRCMCRNEIAVVSVHGQGCKEGLQSP